MLLTRISNTNAEVKGILCEELVQSSAAFPPALEGYLQTLAFQGISPFYDPRGLLVTVPMELCFTAALLNCTEGVDYSYLILLILPVIEQSHSLFCMIFRMLVGALSSDIRITTTNQNFPSGVGCPEEDPG